MTMVGAVVLRVPHDKAISLPSQPAGSRGRSRRPRRSAENSDVLVPR